MRIDIGETEPEAIRRTRYSSELLLRYLRKHHDQNMRPPEGWVKRVPDPAPWYSLAEWGLDKPTRPLIGTIQRVVAKQFGVSRDDIISERRTLKIVMPRQIAMYLSRTMTLQSMPKIGRAFGGRDHTTAIHAFRKIERLIETDAKLAQSIAALREQIA